MIHAIVLAAGESRRMGRPKLLLPLGGSTVIEHIVCTILEGGVEDVTVVVGCKGEEIARTLNALPVAVVTNPDYHLGMLSTLRKGLRHVPAECEGILVALGDQPSIRAGVVRGLLDRFAACPKGIHVPAHETRRGHPLVFASSYRDDVMTKFDDTGLRGLTRLYPDDVREMPVDSDTVLTDMDYPEDYVRELHAFEGRGAADQDSAPR